MAGRTSSALTRTVASFRAFLRESWISRVDLALWLAGWAKRRRETAKPKQGIQLAIEGLEHRNPPDDPVGVLQSPWLGMAGTLLTPGIVFFKGWAAGQFADAGVQRDAPAVLHSTDTTAAAPPVPGLQTWSAATSGAESASEASLSLAPGFGEQPSAFPNAADGDPLQNALTQNWLNAIGNVLDGKRPDPVSAGGYAGSEAGSSSGGGATGSAPTDGDVFAYSGAGFQPASKNGSGANLASLAAFQGATAAASTPVVSALPTTPATAGVPATPAPGSTGGQAAAAASLQTAYAKAPLAFEPNEGQTDPSVKYLSQGPGLSLFITSTSAVFAMPRSDQPGVEDVLALQFVGANPDPQITAGADLLSRSNYFTNTESIVNVPQYSSVTIHNIWPGIDLNYQEAATGGRQLEYDFVVHPGASPDEIQLTWQGAQAITTDAQGDLVLQTARQSLVETAPVFYQGSSTAQQAVSGQQVVNGNQVGFQAAGYDPTQDLLIDPSLGFSSYIGGSGNDYAEALAVDQNGSAYITGMATSTNFPTTVGVYQGSIGSTSAAFVTKLAPNGSIVYSTFLGGAVGPDAPAAYGIAIDSSGSAYVTGPAEGSQFPTTTGAYQSSPGGSFVAKLNATGSALDYATYLGVLGSSPPYATNTTAIAVDPFGNAYLTGTTGSGFATTSGSYQTSYSGSASSEPFITKLNAAGSALIYSSYLGNGGSGQGIALGQSATGAYQAYITGYTASSSFPTTAGAFITTAPNTTKTGFVTAFNAAGSGLLFSTYLGGSNTDSANAITVDRQGNVFVTGSTKSSNFPTTTGVYQPALASSGGGGLGGPGGGVQNAFVTKLNPAGSAALYSTYLGGSGTDAGNSIAVDVNGLAYVAGQTTSSNFPTASGAFQSSLNSATTSAFVTRLNSGATALSYSSYLGGGTSSTNIATGIALDPYQNAYVAGYTNASNFPTANPNQSTKGGGGYNVFISKVVPGTLPPVITAASTNSSGQTPVLTDDQNLTLSGTAPASSTVTVYRGDLSAAIGTATASGGGSWSFNYTATTLAEGTYSFTATATVGSVTSIFSAAFPVTVDLTAPAVAVVAPANTYSEAPQVIVQASDLNGLPDGTSVTLKVDVNRNGSYTGSVSGKLVGGYATLTSPTLAVGYSYNMKAQVTDPAGNTGTSAVVSVTVNSSTPGIQSAGPAISDPLAGDSLSLMGNLQLTHDLMSLDTSPDGGAAAGSPALVYNSAEVSVLPVVQASIQTDNSQALPGTVSAALTWNSTLGATYTYNTTGASPGDLITLAIQEPTTVTSTGAYPWSLTVVMNYGTPVTYTSSGTAYVVTQDSSALGAGWSLSSVDQLVPVSGGVKFVYGTGFARFWSGSSTFTAPEGDNGTLTLSGGVYTYTMPDNEKLKFNSSGYETNWISGDGLSTITYTYDGSNRLSTITATDGTTSTFTYDATTHLLDTIQTSNSRTTTLAYDGYSNLTQITNPDGGVHTFTYDSAHHATGETFANVQNSWAYSGSGALATMTAGSSGSPSVGQLAPAMLQGLETGSTGNLFNVGAVFATETDPALGASTYTYATKTAMDPQGRTTEQIAADGGVTQYALDSNGRVTATTDPLGRTTSYALDSDGYVTQTTYPDSTTSTTHYQSGAYHLPTTVTDQNGNTTTYAYDALGHVTTVKDALGDVTTLAYDATTGLVTTVTDPLGHTTSFAYDSDRRLTTITNPSPAVTTFTYDGNGNPLTTVDANGFTSTTLYDVMGRETGTIDPLGDRTTMTYLANGLAGQSQDGDGNVTAPVYDSYDRGIDISMFSAAGSPVGTAMQVSLDSWGRVTATQSADGWWTQQQFDSVGDVTETIDGQGNISIAQYDLDGELIAARDPMGRLTKYAYNSVGELTSVTDPLGNVTTVKYDHNGNTTVVTNPLPSTTTIMYDALNRPTVTIDGTGATMTTTYDKTGNVSTVTDADGNVTSYTYDAANRQVTETDAVGTAIQRTTTTAYDKDGNVTATTDALTHTTTYIYDNADRQIALTDANSHTTTTVYDAAGNVTATIDALNDVTTYLYDALNQEAETIDPNGNTSLVLYSAGGAEVGSLDGLNHGGVSIQNMAGQWVGSVDALGNLTQTPVNADGETTAVIDPDGNVTKFAYDGDGRVTLTTDPNGNKTTTTYDAASRVSTVTDGDGREIIYSYDNDNRELGEVWKNSGGTTVNTVTFTYDKQGNMLTAADGTGTITMSYDALNLETVVTDVWGLTLTYTYNAADQVTQRADSAGGVQTYTYDNANRQTSVQLGGATPVNVAFGYTNRNDLQTVTRYSNLAGTTVIGTTVYSYDPGDRVTAITNTNGSAATISYYDYTYDNADRVTSQTAVSGTYTYAYNYSYDNSNQVLGSGTATYTYDANGNKNMAGYTTGTGNQITNDGTFTYTYDSVGNLIEKSKGSGLETWYYGYDNRNRLTSVRDTTNGTTNDYTATYTYDVLGQQVEADTWASTPGLVQTRTAYDNGQAWADLTTSNVVETRYVYDPNGNLVARVDVGTGLREIFTDSEGSVRDVTDTSGTVLDHIEYTAFGGIASETGASYGGNFLYTGLYEDRTSGIFIAWARADLTTIGGWMQVDPILFQAGDPNPRRDVGNDPTNEIDPSGLDDGPSETEKSVPEPPTDPNFRADGGTAVGKPKAARHWWDDVKDVWDYVTSDPGDALYQGAVGANEGGAIFVNQATFEQIPWVDQQAKIASDDLGPTTTAIEQGLGSGVEIVVLATVSGDPIGVLGAAGSAAAGDLGQQLWDNGGDLGGVDVGRVGQAGQKAAIIATVSSLIGQGDDRPCFPAGTLVSTAAGLRAIETVQPGEQLWGYDLVTSQWRLSRVRQTFNTHHYGRSVFVTAADDTVEATFRHLFWVVRGEQLEERPRRADMAPVTAGATTPGRWVDAGYLRVGDELLLRDGGIKPVEALRFGFLDTGVYNFDIEGLHTYAVGRNEVLVHNENGYPTGGGGSGADVGGGDVDKIKQWQEEVDTLENRIWDLEDKLDSIRTQVVGHGQNRFDGSEQELQQLMEELADLIAKGPQ